MFLDPNYARTTTAGTPHAHANFSEVEVQNSLSVVHFCLVDFGEACWLLVTGCPREPYPLFIAKLNSNFNFNYNLSWDKL